MGEDYANVRLEELNPTFLFTWKGRREKDEQRYHCHDYLEIAFMMSGKGKYRIDGKIYSVEEGDLLIFNPGVYHQGLVKDVNTAVTEFFVGASDIRVKGLSDNCLPIPKAEPVIHTTGDFRQRLFRYFMMKAYLMQMVVMILRHQLKGEETSSGYAFESVNKKYIVERIVSYFGDHYAEKISLDRIAENMYLSPFYISKIFKSETGEAPIRHLIKIRLEKAMELLGTDDSYSIKEVALKVGYDDAYHFSKLFKKYYGFSPSQVKKQIDQ